MTKLKRDRFVSILIRTGRCGWSILPTMKHKHFKAVNRFEFGSHCSFGQFFATDNCPLDILETCQTGSNLSNCLTAQLSIFPANFHIIFNLFSATALFCFFLSQTFYALNSLLVLLLSLLEITTVM